MKRPALYVTLAFSAGIAASSRTHISISLAIFLSASFLIMALILRNKSRISHLALYASVLLFGAAYYANFCVIPADHISDLVSEGAKKVCVKGVVRDDPVVGTNFYKQKRSIFLMECGAILDGGVWKKAEGLASVSVTPPPEGVDFGDEIILEGELSGVTALKNPGTFDYSKYMEIKGVRASLRADSRKVIKTALSPSGSFFKRSAYAVRERIRAAIGKSFDKRCGAFLKAVLIGDRMDLSENIKEDFMKTGTIHILAISGLHVGLVAAIFMFLFGLCSIPRKFNLLTTLALLVFYSFVAGSNPPITRAVIMFGVFTFGYLIGRDSDTLNTLALAAMLILLSNPRELFDPSFLLSFVSVGSIIIFYPPINKMLDKTNSFDPGSPAGKALRYLSSGVAVSIASWLGSWPFIACYFNIVSPVSLLANLVVIPMLFVLMALAFVFLAVAGFQSVIAGGMAFIISAIADALFALNHMFAIMPSAYFRVAAPSVLLCAFYYATLSLFFIKDKRYLIFAILILCNFTVWAGVLPGDGKLRITFLDVGQGDSALITAPNGSNILVDGAGGGEDDKFDTGRGVIAPYLWNRGVFDLDAVIVTHFHEDHLGGILYILKNFKVGCVIDNGARISGYELYDEYRKIINEKGIRHITASAGDVIGGLGAAKIYILNPPGDIAPEDSNDNSIVFKLKYKDFSALFCGDISSKTMERLMGYGPLALRSDVLKVPHHGGNLGDNNIVKYFINEVSPKMSIISVGRVNRYGAPSRSTVEAILSSGTNIYETRKDGAIAIYADCSGKFSMERKNP